MKIDAAFDPAETAGLFEEPFDAKSILIGLTGCRKAMQEREDADYLRRLNSEDLDADPGLVERLSLSSAINVLLKGLVSDHAHAGDTAMAAAPAQ